LLDPSGSQEPAASLLRTANGRQFGTILADPPWQFQNRTGKVAPEHKRLNRYETMTLDEICELPVADIAADRAHLYLWVPNALLPDGMRVMQEWGFRYVSNIIWEKVRKDGGPDGRGVGFYFRNVTEILLFGVRGKNVRTLDPGRRQVNIIRSQKSNTRSLRDAVGDQGLNCLAVVSERVGRFGEIKPTIPMSLIGRLIQTTAGPLRRLSNARQTPSAWL